MVIVKFVEKFVGKKVGFFFDIKGLEICIELFEGEVKEYLYKIGEKICVVIK